VPRIFAFPFTFLSLPYHLSRDSPILLWSPTCQCWSGFSSLFLINRQLRNEANYIVGAENTWRFQRLSRDTSLRLSSLPTEMTIEIRRLELWVDTQAMLAWTGAWEDGGLNEWKGILRTIKRVVNVDNLSISDFKKIHGGL